MVVISWQDRYMTVAEAAEALGYKERHTRRLIAQGKLATIKIGWLRLVDKASVEQFKQRRSG